MLKKYDAIIFDLGGVLYDIDVQRTIDAFAAYGLQNFEKYYTLKEQSELFDKLEKGFIGEPEFIEAVKILSNNALDPEQIKNAWNAILIGMPVESVALLKELKKSGYKLYLLSNTNIFHYSAIHSEMQEKYALNALADLFDKAYYSFEMGMRKPDIEIFEQVIQENNLALERTAFIDDNADNIKGSILAGIHGIYMPKDKKLADLLAEEGIL